MSKPTVEGASGAFCPGVPSNQAQDFKKESDFFRQLGSIFRQKRKLVHNWRRDGDDVLVAWNGCIPDVPTFRRHDRECIVPGLTIYPHRGEA